MFIVTCTRHMRIGAAPVLVSAHRRPACEIARFKNGAIVMNHCDAQHPRDRDGLMEVLEPRRVSAFGPSHEPAMEVL